MKKAFFIDQIKNFPYITKQNLGLFLGKSAENLKYWIRKMTQEGTLIPIKNNFFIPKTTLAITSNTIKSTRNFFTPIGTFYYQNLKKELFSGYEIKSFRDKQ